MANGSKVQVNDSFVFGEWYKYISKKMIITSYAHLDNYKAPMKFVKESSSPAQHFLRKKEAEESTLSLYSAKNCCCLKNSRIPLLPYCPSYTSMNHLSPTILRKSCHSWSGERTMKKQTDIGF